MRKNTVFIALFLFAFIWCGVSVAAPLTPEQQKAEELAANKYFRILNSDTRQYMSLDELDEVTPLYSTTFDDISDWTIEDNLNDGFTWHSSADNTAGPDDNSYGSLEGDNAPFMWVDSDVEGDGVHMIEGLVSPVIDATSSAYVYLAFDTYYNDSSPTAGDSARVEYSTDGGSTWTIVESWNEDVTGYPYIIDMTDYVANSSFQVKFVYDDGDDWLWLWGIDNVRVLGSDTEGEAEFEAPDVEITSGPAVGFVGDDQEVVTIATDNVSLTSLTMSYATYAGGVVSNLTSVEMTATENDDEFSATIPGTFASALDTVIYFVSAVDPSGNEGRDPADPNDAYGYVTYSADMNYTLEQVETFSWIPVSGNAVDLELTDDSHAELVFANVGLGDFSWYGETFSQIEIYSNGWAAFGPHNSSSTIFTGVMPNTSTPNGILAPLAADLEPDATGSGQVYYEVADGKLIISWDGVFFYSSPDDSGPKTQIVLDFNTGAVQFNLDTVAGFMNGEDPYTRTHTIGFENGGGSLGFTLYQGSDFGTPENMTSWKVSVPGGTVAGHVYEADGTTPIADATVTVLTQDEPASVVSTAMTDENGAYSIDAIEGTYDVQAEAFGFVTAITNDVDVVLDQETTVNFSLDAQEEIVTVAGTVMSADSEDTPVAGAVVNVVGSGATGFTGQDGTFSLTPDIPAGTYTVYITHNPTGSMGYHDVTLTGVVIDGEHLPLTLYMPEVLAPQNVMATSASGSIVLNWDAPANHESPTAIRHGIDIRREQLRGMSSVTDPAALAKLRILASELRVLETRLQVASSSNGLDELSEFVGYRVYLDGVMQEGLVTGTSATISELNNGQVYDLQVAADYGYNQDYLVPSEVISARPQSAPGYTHEVTDYTWLDIRPSEGGSGTRVIDAGDDVNSGLHDMGMTFTFYGIPYEQIVVCSNSWVSFVSEVSTYEVPVPNTNAPNAIISPAQFDMDAEATDDGEGVWEWYDSENNLFYVQWSLVHHEELDAMRHFQLVLDGSDNSMNFYYNSCDGANGWIEPTGNFWTGVENETGEEAYLVTDFTIADESALRLYVEDLTYGNFEGMVSEAGTDAPVANANIIATSASGVEYTTVSGEDGSYALLELDQDDAPYDVEVTAGGYISTSVEDIDWLESEDYVHVENFVLTPIDPATPPTVLDPNGLHDDGIGIYIAEPGALTENEVLAHDNGVVGDATGWNPGYTTDYWFATKFSVAGRGVHLAGSSLRFLIYSDFDQWWPEGDESHQAVVVGVFNDNGNGMPGELVYMSDEVTPTEEEPWIDVEMDLDVTPTFFVGFYNATPESGQEPLSLDEDNDNSALYTSVDGGATWNLSSSGDPMVRAAVTYFPGGAEEPVVATIEPSAGNAEKPGYFTKLASHSFPMYGFGKKTLAPHHADFFSSIDELDELVGFNVEYSTNGTDWTQANAELIEGHEYFLNMGSENENTEYSIRAFAVVTNPEGGDDIVSDPSDVVTATYNMAPLAPTELTGSVDEDVVSLTWTAPTTNADGTELVDLAGYNVYIVGDDELELLGTSETNSFSATVEESGVVTFAVAAVDEVPNESMLSGTIAFIVNMDGFSTSFEPNEWNDTEADAPWALGTPATAEDLNGAHTGDNAWATNLTGDYANEEDAMLKTTEPLAVNSADAVLAYYHWIQYESYGAGSSYDGYNVNISTDGGSTWTIIDPVGGYTDTEIVGLDDDPGFTGESEGWQLVQFDIGDFVGQTILIGFRHGTDTSVLHFGGAIDDLSLYGVAPPVYGTVTGIVRNCAEDGPGVNGADVFLDGQLLGQTNVDGTFDFEALAGTHTFTFEHDNFWTATVEGQTVPEEDELDLGNIIMTRPEAEVDPTTLPMTIPLGDSDPVTETIELTNVGCGPMEFSVSINILNAANEVVGSYPENVQPSDITEVADLPYFQNTKQSAATRGPVAVSELDETWDMLDTFDADVISGAQDNLSAWVDGNSGYIMQFNSPYNIYEFDFSGNLVETHTPSTGGAQWWNEIEYDPTTGLVMTAAANGDLYQFLPDGSNATNIASVGVDAWGLAYDYDNGIVYYSNAYEQNGWGMLNLSTSVNTTLAEPAPGGYPWAMMYVPNDPNGNTIYASFSEDPTAGPAAIYGFNPTTQTWTSNPITTLYTDGSYAVVGMTGTHDWSGNLDFVLFAQGNEIPDHVDIYEGTALQSWLTVDPSMGTLLPGESTTITVTVDLAADPTFQPVDGQNVTGQVIISGPKMADTIVTVDMVFTSAGENNDLMPAKYALHQNYPNPFNPSTAIKFDLIAAQKVNLTVYNMLGQEVARLVDGQMQAGFHNVSFDASRLASGVYFYRLETPAFTSMKKMVLVK